MKTILTLTVGEFHFVDDLFLLALMVMGIFGFLFLKASSFLQVPFRSRERLALDLAGIIAIVTSLCFFWLSRSWNNAFELAGNSYAASGHLFREDYRYVAWFLTAPLLLTAFVAALPLDAARWRFFLPRLVIPSAAIIFFGYSVKIRSEAHGVFVPVISYLCVAVAFFYIIHLLWKNIPQVLTDTTERVFQLFLKAPRFLLISWVMYPLIDFLSSLSYFSSSSGVIFMITAYGLTDVISQCGIGIYIYELLKAQGEEVS